MPKYKDILNYVLGMLYTLKIQGYTKLYNLGDILASLKYPVNMFDLQQIARYLEAQGYIRAMYKLGAIFVRITPMGMMYIEDNKEIFYQFKKYFEDVRNIDVEISINETDNLIIAKTEREIRNPTPEEIKKDRKNIFNKIDEIIALIRNSWGVKGYDLEIDIIILKAELEKINPDKEIIGNKLSTIGNIDLLRESYNELVLLLNI